jgi:hypothetical protein
MKRGRRRLDACDKDEEWVNVGAIDHQCRSVVGSLPQGFRLAATTSLVSRTSGFVCCMVYGHVDKNDAGASKQHMIRYIHALVKKIVGVFSTCLAISCVVRYDGLALTFIN